MWNRTDRAPGLLVTLFPASCSAPSLVFELCIRQTAHWEAAERVCRHTSACVFAELYCQCRYGFLVEFLRADTDRKREGERERAPLNTLHNLVEKIDVKAELWKAKRLHVCQNSLCKMAFSHSVNASGHLGNFLWPPEQQKCVVWTGLYAITRYYLTLCLHKVEMRSFPRT